MNETTQTASEFLTEKEVAAALRCSEVTVWRLRSKGHLAYHKVLGKTLIRRSDLEAYLHRVRTATLAEGGE